MEIVSQLLLALKIFFLFGFKALKHFMQPPLVCFILSILIFLFYLFLFCRYKICPNRYPPNIKDFKKRIIILIVVLIGLNIMLNIVLNAPSTDLFFWAFSTLAQVFGAFVGLAIVVITTVIIGYEQDNKPSVCLENIIAETKLATYPSVLVVAYSIFFVIIPSTVFGDWYKVIIIVCGMEIPLLAIFSLTVLIDTIMHCRQEKLDRKGE
jgi:hypothetical protein